MKNVNKLLGASLLTAITASLCCITPVLALVAGTSGIASSFSWLEPIRPYLIGITILVLALAWYNKIIRKSFGNRKEMNCECEPELKPKFNQSKTFLGIITVIAIVMLAFPYYSNTFYPNTAKKAMVATKSEIKTTEFKISGMTCAGCELHVDHEVNKLDGIVNSKSSYENGNAVIEFDSTKTSETEIESAINATGYKVTAKKDN